MIPQPTNMDAKFQQELQAELQQASNEATSEDQSYPWINTVFQYYRLCMQTSEGTILSVGPQYRLAHSGMNDPAKVVIPDFVIVYITRHHENFQSDPRLLVEVKRLILEEGEDWFNDSNAAHYLAWHATRSPEVLAQVLSQGYLALKRDPSKDQVHLMIIVGMWFSLLEFRRPKSLQGSSNVPLSEKTPLQSQITLLVSEEECPTPLFTACSIFATQSEDSKSESDPRPDLSSFSEAFLTSLSLVFDEVVVGNNGLINMFLVPKFTKEEWTRPPPNKATKDVFDDAQSTRGRPPKPHDIGAAFAFLYSSCKKTQTDKEIFGNYILSGKHGRAESPVRRVDSWAVDPDYTHSHDEGGDDYFPPGARRTKTSGRSIAGRSVLDTPTRPSKKRRLSSISRATSKLV